MGRIVRRRDARPGPMLFGLPVEAIPADEVIARILAAGEGSATLPFLATYLNAHVSNLAASDTGLRKILASSDLLYADGQAIVWALRAAHGVHGERASAAYFLRKFCWGASARGVRVALVGGARGLARKTARRLSKEVPGLKIEALHHGYVTPADYPAIAERIRLSGAQVVLLGMGSPHQERLAAHLRRERVAPCLWCVGALFEYFGSGRPTAPLWMRELGLEWLFRFAQEPARLATRYSVGNARFIARAVGETIGAKLGR